MSAGTRCWLTGWGTLQSGGSQPEILQQVSVPVVSQGTCKKSYKNKIHDSMICAGYPEGGKDACQGDSGNPRGKSGISIDIPTPLVRHQLHGSISLIITTNIEMCSPLCSVLTVILLHLYSQVDLWCVRRAAGFSCTEPPAGVTAARSDTNTECTPESTT